MNRLLWFDDEPLHAEPPHVPCVAPPDPPPCVAPPTSNIKWIAGLVCVRCSRNLSLLPLGKHLRELRFQDCSAGIWCDDCIANLDKFTRASSMVLNLR